MTPPPKRNGRVGRFPIPPEEHVRAREFATTDAEAERIKAAARKEGRTFSQYVRRAAVAAAEKTNGRNGDGF